MGQRSEGDPRSNGTETPDNNLSVHRTTIVVFSATRGASAARSIARPDERKQDRLADAQTGQGHDQSDQESSKPVATNNDEPMNFVNEAKADHPPESQTVPHLVQLIGHDQADLP